MLSNYSDYWTGEIYLLDQVHILTHWKFMKYKILIEIFDFKLSLF
jgi:hypothetical protein